MIKINKPISAVIALALTSIVAFLGTQFKNSYNANESLPLWVTKKGVVNAPAVVASSTNFRSQLKPVSSFIDESGQEFLKYKGFCSGVSVDIPRELHIVSDSYLPPAPSDTGKYSAFIADGKPIENGGVLSGFKLASAILAGPNDPYLDVSFPKKTKVNIAGMDAYSVDTSALESGIENILLYRVVEGKNLRYSFFFHNINQRLRNHIIVSFAPLGLPDASKCY